MGPIPGAPFVGTCGHVFCRRCIDRTVDATEELIQKNMDYYGLVSRLL